MNNSMSVVLIVIINLNSLLIGYLFGRLYHSYGVNNNQSFIKQNQQISKKSNDISIDSTKFVTDIKTDSMEKKYEKLGEVKKSEENITNSVDKLKSLKR